MKLALACAALASMAAGISAQIEVDPKPTIRWGFDLRKKGVDSMVTNGNGIAATDGKLFATTLNCHLVIMDRGDTAPDQVKVYRYNATATTCRSTPFLFKPSDANLAEFVVFTTGDGHAVAVNHGGTHLWTTKVGDSALSNAQANRGGDYVLVTHNSGSIGSIALLNANGGGVAMNLVVAGDKITPLSTYVINGGNPTVAFHFFKGQTTGQVYRLAYDQDKPPATAIEALASVGTPSGPEPLPFPPVTGSDIEPIPKFWSPGANTDVYGFTTNYASHSWTRVTPSSISNGLLLAENATDATGMKRSLLCYGYQTSSATYNCVNSETGADVWSKNNLRWGVPGNPDLFLDRVETGEQAVILNDLGMGVVRNLAALDGSEKWMLNCSDYQAKGLSCGNANPSGAGSMALSPAKDRLYFSPAMYWIFAADTALSAKAPTPAPTMAPAASPTNPPTGQSKPQIYGGFDLRKTGVGSYVGEGNGIVANDSKLFITTRDCSLVIMERGTPAPQWVPGGVKVYTYSATETQCASTPLLFSNLQAEFVVFTTIDGHAVAVDHGGTQVWTTKVGESKLSNAQASRYNDYILVTHNSGAGGHISFLDTNGGIALTRLVADDDITALSGYVQVRGAVYHFFSGRKTGYVYRLIYDAGKPPVTSFEKLASIGFPNNIDPQFPPVTGSDTTPIAKYWAPGADKSVYGFVNDYKKRSWSRTTTQSVGNGLLLASGASDVPGAPGTRRSHVCYGWLDYNCVDADYGTDVWSKTQVREFVSTDPDLFLAHVSQSEQAILINSLRTGVVQNLAALDGSLKWVLNCDDYKDHGLSCSANIAAGGGSIALSPEKDMIYFSPAQYWIFAADSTLPETVGSAADTDSATKAPAGGTSTGTSTTLAPTPSPVDEPTMGFVPRSGSQVCSSMSFVWMVVPATVAMIFVGAAV